jgi:tetratricopeptide (TPR) repeat protein
VAGLLEEFGEKEAAGALYQKAVDHARQPETVLVLARYLGRQGQAGKALDLCQQAWKTCPPDAVAAACLAVLSSSAAGPEQMSRVEGWLQDLSRRTPEGTAPLLHLAALRNLQGRYGEAEELYRRVLGRDRDNVQALNNLAWLLALSGGAGAEALALVERALEVGGPDAALRDTRALVRVAAGQCEQAAGELEEVVQEAPTAPRYFHLALAHRKLKNDQAARGAWRKARGLGLGPAGLHPLEHPAYRELHQLYESAPRGGASIRRSETECSGHESSS